MNDEKRITPCDLSIEERTVGDKTVPVLVGYAAVFGKRSVDLGGFTEEIAPGAFSDSIRADDIIAAVEHDAGQIIGRLSAGTLRLTEDETGLRFEADLPDTTAGRDIRESVSRRDVTGASFKFRAISDKWEKRDGMDHRTLLKAKLFDVGPVTFPAYPDTSVAMRSRTEWNLSISPINAIGMYLKRQKHAESLGR
jgi:HK97 family phage prohead protease